MRRALLLLVALVPEMAFAQGAVVPVDVLARPVARGEVVSVADFVPGSISAPLARSALRAQDAGGLAATRLLMAGSIVRAADLSPPALVKRGEAVTLLLRAGTLTISAPGKALGDGGAGASVRVVNLATNRTIDGQVEAPGRVLIPAP